jgi:hypothetical protein
VVEVSDEEFTMIKDFVINELGGAIDWDAPDTDQALKEKYIRITQILNAFGQEAESNAGDDSTAAPGG